MSDTANSNLINIVAVGAILWLVISITTHRLAHGSRISGYVVTK